MQELFAGQHRYVVPPYQRAYVWTEERQWLPLWEDIERTADARAEENDQHHFLGAIVIRREKTPPGGITEWSVIDGQQRLTTLQLALSALADAARSDGFFQDAKRLEKLIHHDELEADGDLRFKFWPTSVNRAAFRDVTAEGGPNHGVADDPNNMIHEAWSFFRVRAYDYAHADAADTEVVGGRYSILREVLSGLMQIVTIDLEKNDPAQVIFETLNARGTPLLAIELVKNALFGEAESSGADIDEVNRVYWRELDDRDYWGKDQRLGRLTVPRSEAFLMHWLAMQLGEVIATDRLFELFRRDVLGSPDTDAMALIGTLNEDAAIMRGFDTPQPGSTDARFFDALSTVDTTTMHPVALLLFRSEELQDGRRNRALSALASYLIRRMVCGFSAKNYSQLAARLIKKARADVSHADDAIVEELLESQADTYRWPTDDEVFSRLQTHPLAGWLGQHKIVLLLSTVELAARKGKVEAIDTLPRKLEVEHIMPRAWRTNWPVDPPTDEEKAKERDASVDRLGNLTLVTKSLNASMSNAAWEKKRGALEEHSLLVLNRDLVKRSSWSEQDIRGRGSEVGAKIVELWPGPQTFMPEEWQPKEAESWPDAAQMEVADVKAVYASASPYLRAVLDALSTSPDTRRRFRDVEASLQWPRGRLSSVCGGYGAKTAPAYGGKRPWHVHLDSEGVWWMWMDGERAAALNARLK